LRVYTCARLRIDGLLPAMAECRETLPGKWGGSCACDLLEDKQWFLHLLTLHRREVTKRPKYPSTHHLYHAPRPAYLPGSYTAPSPPRTTASVSGGSAWFTRKNGPPSSGVSRLSHSMENSSCGPRKAKGSKECCRRYNENYNALLSHCLPREVGYGKRIGKL